MIAKYLASLISPIPSHARILDNATATGVMVEEILNSIQDHDVSDTVSITAVGAAPAMIDVVQSKARSDGTWKIREDQLHVEALAAEDLDSLPDDHFDYSFTVFGFQFFKDPGK